VLAVKKYILLFVLLVISIVFVTCRVAIEKVKQRKLEVDAYALESAFSVAEYIGEYSECPIRPHGWKEAFENERGNIELKIGYIRLTYQCKMDLSAKISVFYSFDSEAVAYIKPSGNIKWEYGHFTAKKEVHVVSRESILATLNAIR